jgi:hypothetical protein
LLTGREIETLDSLVVCGNTQGLFGPEPPSTLQLGGCRSSIFNARQFPLGTPVTASQTDRVTSVLIARIPPEGIEDFRAYEDAVLPLLPEFNGRLERRLRNSDGTVEMHIVSFASEADRQNYRNDPRRKAQAWRLEKSSAKLELLPMTTVP